MQAGPPQQKLSAEELKQKILSIVRLKGPVLPVQVSKELGVNILFGAAMLSELVDNKVLRITSTKIGGSPLYYVDGQEYKLQSLMQHLHEKERKAVELLKQKQVLQDSALEPVARAALRTVKDFAKPMEVNYQGKMLLFWRWYLAKQIDAELLIKQILYVPKEEPKQREVQKVLEKPKAEKIERAEMKKEEPRREEVREELVMIDAGEPNDRLYHKAKKFFENSKVQVLKHKIIKKENEIDFIVEIPSTIGRLLYFCKARSKKKCNEGDLSSVYLQGHKQKLPVLFLITGDLTKKAQQLLETEFKGMQIKLI